MILAAWRGHEGQASELIEATAAEAATRRWTSNNYARSVLYNGLGRHDAARDAAWEAFQPDPIGYGSFLVPELAEAAARTGDRALLEFALEWLSERTRVISSGWATGIEARVRALRERGRGRRRVCTASRSRTSPVPVCDSSSPGLTFSTGSGCAANVAASTPESSCASRSRRSPAWAPRRSRRRAERELLATGEHARKRTVETLGELTPQEAQISRLVAQGHTNREIAAQLFISPSTVEYHLRKVFRKLGVKSRTQLANRLLD